MSSNDSLKPQYGWTVSLFLPFTPATAKFVSKYSITANQISWASLVVFILGLIPYILGQHDIGLRLTAAFLFTLGTFFDVLDGAVARYTKTASKYGALLDSVIDLIRYNLFFATMYFLISPQGITLLALALYAFLLNYSFITYYRSLFSKKGRRQPNTKGIYDQFLPLRYKQFCLKHSLLFNPMNIEDQLLFMFFIIGVVFQVEPVILYICLFFRLIDVVLILRKKIISS